MIVKNEAGRILRALNSAAPHIACWAILDTGSTDGTQEIIEDWAALNNIPGDIGHSKFVDFAQARNEALALARKREDYEYLLLFDADMELVVKDKDWLYGLVAESYDMYQAAGSLQYQNRRLLSRFSPALYVTPTHEFLNAPSGGCIPMEKALFNDYADGSNRKEKFKRDIKILKKAIKEKNGPEDRLVYYLAQSYRDAGDFSAAAKWYQRRIDIGGWPEEVWSAYTALASCHLSMGNIGEFLRCNIAAYDFRPSRSETLYDVAKYYREKGQNHASLLFSEPGMKIPWSTDGLFVNDYVYKHGHKDEFSICAYYVPGRRDDGFRVCDELALNRSPYGNSAFLANANLLHYMGSLGASCPSLQLKQIDFTAEDGWTAMNPSVCLHRGELKALVRTVNYRMDEHGRYLIRGTDGTANASNPINTRNWLLPLDRDLGTITQIELVPREPLACEYPLVVGFEDARIFDHGDNLYISATVRQRSADGLAEQTLARIGGPAGDADALGGYARLGLVDVAPMLRHPRLYEKNWMPIVGHPDGIRFMYRPGHVVDQTGQDTGSIRTPKTRTDTFSGSSQLIRTEYIGDIHTGGWLGIIHEAHVYTDAPHKRYYNHRFVWYSDDFTLQRVSKPFFFKDKVIEFVAGLSYHPEAEELIISFGFRDCEAWLARVKATEVWNFLCQGHVEPK